MGMVFLVFGMKNCAAISHTGGGPLGIDYFDDDSKVFLVRCSNIELLIVLNMEVVLLHIVDCILEVCGST
jgi:hypothetical protein